MARHSKKQLTDTRIQKARTEPRMYYLWDSAVRGFGLRITPQGTKNFCLKFIAPTAEKPQAWMLLGAYTGPESLEDARAKATEYRRLIEEGIDPRNQLKEHLKIPSLGTFIDTYLDEQKKRLRPSSYRSADDSLNGMVAPVLGDLRISEVQRHHVEDLYTRIGSGWRPGMKMGKRPAKPTPITANRLLANLSKLFMVAERRGLRPQGSNPCKLVEKYAESKGRERFLTMEEFGWVFKVLDDAPHWGDADHASHAYAKGLSIPDVYAIAAIRLLMFTGARLNEILQLKWSEVNRERRVIRLESHKTSRKAGAKELPINSEVLAVLDGLEKLPTRHLKSEWVIQGHKHGSHFVGLQKVWERVRVAVNKASNDKVNIDSVRLHDLRHSFVSVGVSHGMTLPMAGSLVGHTQPSSTGRYAHLHSDPRLEASEQIAAKIASAKK